MEQPLCFGPEEEAEADRLIRLALAEDLPGPDITSDPLIPAHATVRGVMVFREEGIVCGIPVVERLLRALDRSIETVLAASDGTRAARGSAVLEMRGPARSVLAAERSALNFLQRLSGIATRTARWVATLRGLSLELLDTRKTIPGWRRLEKYAVRAGGGRNHRVHLSDQALLKDNHVRILRELKLGEPRQWVETIRRAHPGLAVELEVESLAELRAAADCGADILLLDNFPLDGLSQAVAEVRTWPEPRPLLEASGGIDERRLVAVAKTGVDRISSGALTHSAPAHDVAFDLLEVHS